MGNEKLCPFCNRENACMASGTPKACWCTQVRVPIELQRLIPAHMHNKSCICADCIRQFNQDPEGFSRDLKLSNKI